MPSNPVIRRQRVADAMRTSLTEHEDATLGGLQERLGRLLGEGQVIDSYKNVHQFFVDLLDAREAEMVAADEAHLAEEMDDRNPRRLRDRAAAAVYDVLVGIRRAADGHFGSELAAEVLNIEGPTSRDPVIVFRQGSRAMERLQDAELVLPVSRLSDGVPDREGWAARLEPALTELEAALGKVGVEERQLALTRATKKQAVADLDQDIGALSRILEGFMILADRRDLSAAIRPGRLNRRARARAQAETQSSEEPTQGEGPPGSEGTPEPTPTLAAAAGASPGQQSPSSRS